MLNDYFRKRNLTDLPLLKSLNKEVLQIGGVEFRYILKENVVNNPLLGESAAVINYERGFSTTGLLQGGVLRDDASNVGILGAFWDERVRVDIDLNTWLGDIRNFLGEPEYKTEPKEGDYMILVNEQYSYDMFEVASVRRYDYYLQFNEKQVYTIYLKKAVLGENLYTNFDEALSTTEPNSDAKVQMVDNITNVNTAMAPSPTSTPSMGDFSTVDFLSNDIDNLGF